MQSYFLGNKDKVILVISQTYNLYIKHSLMFSSFSIIFRLGSWTQMSVAVKPESV